MPTDSSTRAANTDPNPSVSSRLAPLIPITHVAKTELTCCRRFRPRRFPRIPRVPLQPTGSRCQDGRRQFPSRCGRSPGGRPLALVDRFTSLGVPCAIYLRDAAFDNLGGPVVERDGVRFVATSRDLARRFAEAFGIHPPSIPPIVRPERYRVESSRKSVTFVCPFPAKGVDIALALAARRADIPFVFVESWQMHPVRRAIAENADSRQAQHHPPPADRRHAERLP